MNTTFTQSKVNKLFHFHPNLTAGVTLSLWANTLNRELCPVTALFSWLLIPG